MSRIHLFEFEDQKWFPSFLRNYGTDFLQFLSNKTKMYKPIIPFIRPFKMGRIIFTYLLPIVPFFVLWDGVVSALRTYSVKEMTNLVESLENTKTFNWEIERIKSGPGVILYLLGTKK